MKILSIVLLIFVTNIALSNEIIIQFEKGTTSSQINNLLEKNRLKVISETYLSTGRVFLVSTSKQIDELKTSSIIQYINTNHKRYNVLAYVPNDSLFPLQWGAVNLGYNIPPHDPNIPVIGIPDMDMGTDSAWDYTRGSSKVIVAILDTGIDTLHEDLIANLIPGSGWNFITNQRGAMDDHYHGTSCAGVLGAVGNNLLGISGVCPVLKIFPVKVIGTFPIPYATEYSLVSGVVYAYQHGAWVSSNSWLWDSIPPSALLKQAILDGVTLGRGGKGTVYVFPSNNAGDEYVVYPARDYNVIGVGAMNPCGRRQNYYNCSNEGWGSNYDSTLDVVAPGVKNVTPGLMGNPNNQYGNYRKASGTSTATPMVSGVCALVLSIDSSLTYREVMAIVTSTATKLPFYTYTNGKNIEVGYGLVSANKASQAVFYNGDINQDGVIDLWDIIAVYNDMNAFTTGIVRTDVSRDLAVDLTDLIQIQSMVK